MTPEEAVARVCLDLAEHFDSLDDDPDAPFGELARVEDDGAGRIVVMHETEEWGIEIVIRPIP